MTRPFSSAAPSTGQTGASPPRPAVKSQLAAALKRPVARAGSTEAQQRGKRLLSLVQSHLKHPATTCVDAKRREIEERLASRLAAEKALLQAELDREEAERAAKRQARNESTLKMLLEERAQREQCLGAFSRTEVGLPSLFYCTNGQ